LADLPDNFHFLPHFNSKTTEQIFTIFSHDVKQLLELLMRVFTRRYAIPFRNDRAISACRGVGNFAPFFSTKLVAMAKSLEELEKLDQIKKIHANTFHLVKRS